MITARKQVKQPGFFDVAKRAQKRERLGDPLVALHTVIDWEAFRSDLESVHQKERKSNAGAKPFDVVLIFKMLILQQLHNLSDDGIEYQVRDRPSFMRFLGLQMEDKVPDAKTIWLYRERLKSQGLTQVLFERFHEQLAKHGYIARGGQMIDATLVEVPRQRNTKEENTQIKSGTTPEDWQSKPHKLAQKDVDARWTKKNEERYYGYKNHINADQANKLIHDYVVSDASVHDSQVFEGLLDDQFGAKGKKRAIYADSAYRSKEQEAKLEESNIPSRVCEKGARNRPLTKEQKAANKEKSKIRSRIEHIFGAQAQMGGHIVRTIGMVRARIKIGLMNLTYNMKRLVVLLRKDGKGMFAAGSKQ